jgi:hypothetical protein
MKNMPLLHQAMRILNVKKVLHVSNVNNQPFGQSEIMRIPIWR